MIESTCGHIAYRYRQGILYWEVTSQKKLFCQNRKMKEIIVLAHVCLTSTHRSEKETIERIKEEFFWPGMFRDIKVFCRSCDVFTSGTKTYTKICETSKYFVGLVTCSRWAPTRTQKCVSEVEAPLNDKVKERQVTYFDQKTNH